MTDRYQLPTLHVAYRSTFNPLPKAANDNQLAWPPIQFPEGWNAAC